MSNRQSTSPLKLVTGCCINWLRNHSKQEKHFMNERRFNLQLLHQGQHFVSKVFLGDLIFVKQVIERAGVHHETFQPGYSPWPRNTSWEIIGRAVWRYQRTQMRSSMFSIWAKYVLPGRRRRNAQATKRVTKLFPESQEEINTLRKFCYP